jgi:hypothetical protein
MLILVIDDDGDSTFTFKLGSEDDDGHGYDSNPI